MTALDGRALIETLADGVVVVDPEGRVLHLNPAAERLLGRSAAELIGEQVGLPLEDRPGQEVDLVTPVGPPLVAELRVSAVEWEDRPALLILLRDVTARIEAQAAAVRAHVEVSALLQAVPAAILRWDAEGRLTTCNEMAERLLGRTAAELVGGPCPLLALIREHEPALARRIADGERIGEEDLELPLPTGAGRTPITLSTVPVAGGGTVAVVGDATKRHRRDAAVRHLATHDSLTDLPNRHSLEQSLERVVSRVRQGGPPGVFLVVDLDHFKAVNDTHGHLAGDTLLVAIGQALLHALRPGDILGRFGGDELGVVLQGMDADGAEAIATRLCETVESTRVAIADASVATTTTIGGAVIDGRLEAAEVFAVADLALFDAKTRGRNCAAIRRDADGRALALAMASQWTRRLRRALAADDLELHFQPIFDLRTGGVHAMEALLRVRDGGRLHHPGEFLAVADAIGALTEIDRRVVRTVLELLEQGTVPRVSVNVSRAALADEVLRELVEAWSATNGPPAGRLIFEVPVEVAMTEAEPVGRLQDAGVVFSVDAGTAAEAGGPSERASYLKLTGAALDEPAEAVDQWHAAGKLVIAARIESESQRRAASDAGADLAQGFLLAPPAKLT